MADEFRTFAGPDLSFDDLLAAVRFEDVGKGRRGAVAIKPSERGLPIVRTTTPYREPAQSFEVLDRLASEIQHIAGLSCELNNALVEHYTSAYAKMAFHSDQALDLADDTAIAIYSCYREPRAPSRRLIVKAKHDAARFEIPLVHGSVVVFSLETNRRYTHTIAPTDNGHDDWLGFTMRTSKTFVRFVDGQPQLSGARLIIANEAQRREFFQLRGRENAETDFTWPALTYTLSESDLMPL